MKQKRWFLILPLVLIGLVMFYLRWGSFEMSLSQVLQTLLGRGDALQNLAIYGIRMPRLLVGIMVAGLLAISGGVLQTLTKNDLSDPSILGINAGVATAAVIFIGLKTSSYHQALGAVSIFILPVVAIFGAVLTASMLVILTGKAMKPGRLLLMGLGIQSGLSAVILLITFRGGVGDYNRVLVWLSGSLWGSGWYYVYALLPVFLGICFWIFRSTKTLDVMLLSDEHVMTLGLNVTKARLKFFLASVVMAGTATAFAGNIGFIGLICPHMARKLVGPYHKNFLWVSGLLASILMLFSDLLARNLFSPIEIPVGIIISLFGVPYFIYLLLKEK